MEHTLIIEWLADRWRRSLKYEEIHAKAYDSIAEPRAEIGANLRFYKDKRLHHALAYPWVFKRRTSAFRFKIWRFFESL